jgi:dolichol-phosphate mannosyltransferase
MGVKDPTGGFKCFRRTALERLDLDAITPRGYAFQIETTYRLKRLGCRVVEIPITFADREVGTSKMSKAVFLEAVWRVPLLRVRG